jgi:hypothetical protein
MPGPTFRRITGCFWNKYILRVTGDYLKARPSFLQRFIEGFSELVSDFIEAGRIHIFKIFSTTRQPHILKTISAIQVLI